MVKSAAMMLKPGECYCCRCKKEDDRENTRIK